MSEHPNVALVRSGYAAFSTGDMAALAKLFADDVVWHVGGRSALSGDYKGQSEVFNLFARLFEMSAGTFKLEVHAVLADDEHAVALVHGTAEKDDARYSANEAHIFHLSDGRVTEFWAFSEDQYAEDAFFA